MEASSSLILIGVLLKLLPVFAPMLAIMHVAVMLQDPGGGSSLLVEAS